jgi:hypothetical protein
MNETIADKEQLDGSAVIQTTARLVRRVEERFPGSGLGGVCVAIHATSLNTQDQIDELLKPIWRLRVLAIAMGFVSASLLLYLLLGGVEWSRFVLPNTFKDFIGLLEPTLGSVIFLTAYSVFVSTVEKRWKQARVLQALTKLRGLAHVIDMHQLTKNPERFMLIGPDTEASPDRSLSPFEVGRYLDYCSEMLSILGKVSALWAQAFPEPTVLVAVDQIETLTVGLSRKIWQKLMVLQGVVPTVSQDDGAG